jgi:hypothetical protein
MKSSISNDLTMTVHSNKRKAIQLTKEYTLNDCMEQLVALTKSTDERFKKMEEQIDPLTKTMNEMNSFDRSIEAIAKASDSEDEEDLSDDEESVVDESDKWTMMFRQLREYRTIHGDCRVPRSYKENPKRARWVDDQRTAYRNFKTGKGKKIRPERKIKLDSLGFFWSKNNPHPPSWDEMFEKLHNYQQKMGNCDVPFNATNLNALARWTAYQRAKYKRFKNGKDSLLTLDQIRQLKEIGMKWKGPKLREKQNNQRYQKVAR